MTPAISVILPTVRPHLVARAIKSIGPACGSVPYEVVVVADFGIGALCDEDVPECRWIISERRGVVDAVNVACAHASGDYWFLFNDESVLAEKALEILYHEAQKDPAVLLTIKHEPSYPFVYYGRFFAPFPFAHRSLYKSLGGMLDPIYRGFYADPDLSMRAHTAGVPIRVVDSAVLRHENKHDDMHRQCVQTYLEADRAVFQQRWNHLGEFKDP